MTETGPDIPERLLPKQRLEAFSDGVFAIVVTLLVLDLEVPKEPDHLWRALAESWPAFLGYVVSFAFIGGAWIGHSNMTRFIRAADPILMRLNLVLLLFVSMLPFTTRLMSLHLNDNAERAAVVIFGINLTLAALLLNGVVAYAARTADLAADDVAEEELRAFEKERRVALVLLGAATLVGVLLPLVAVLVFLAISLLLLIDPLYRAHRLRRFRAARHE